MAKNVGAPCENRYSEIKKFEKIEAAGISRDFKIFYIFLKIHKKSFPIKNLRAKIFS